MNDYVLYVHTFPNGKYYVGITKQDVCRRWREGKGYEGQLVFDAILKYGWDNIRHEIVATGLTKDEAEQLEIEMIKCLHSLSHENGYNIDKGGNCISGLSDEVKAKISATKKGKHAGQNHWHYGGHWSDDVKKKISEAHKGMKYGEETLKKKRAIFRGKGNPMYGTKMTPEHKAKVQEACVKAKSRSVVCIETGKAYESSAEAQRQTGICSRSILYVCNKDPRYKMAGGFHWEYK